MGSRLGDSLLFSYQVSTRQANESPDTLGKQFFHDKESGSKSSKKQGKKRSFTQMSTDSKGKSKTKNKTNIPIFSEASEEADDKVSTMVDLAKQLFGGSDDDDDDDGDAAADSNKDGGSSRKGSPGKQELSPSPSGKKKTKGKKSSGDTPPKKKRKFTSAMGKDGSVDTDGGGGSDDLGFGAPRIKRRKLTQNRELSIYNLQFTPVNFKKDKGLLMDDINEELGFFKKKNTAGGSSNENKNDNNEETAEELRQIRDFQRYEKELGMKYDFIVMDVLSTIAPISGMEIGPSYDTKYIHCDYLNTWIANGFGLNGQISMIQEGIRPQILARLNKIHASHGCWTS